jgi:hypothetical protein
MSPTPADIRRYRNGGDGFVAWAEENVRIPIYAPGSTVPDWIPIKDLPNTKHKDTGRSPAEFWQNMAKVARASLVLGDDGLFIFRLIVFCWMRGEAKSLLTCLIQMWKFYCFPKQLIVLGANSKDQVKFVHFDIIKDIIINSPKLLTITGRKNIQEKEIRLKNKVGAVMSTIRSISSFSGIVSNITGYTFSEIFDLKNPKFFYQLDGSIRNIPNALGIIDSTVSTKQHILYRLFRIWEKKKDPTLFFSYRYSLRADYRDYWHPAMTKVQLSSYRIKFPKADFDQYFKNTWESGSKKLFSPTLVKATHFLGFGNQLGMQTTILASLATCLKAHVAIRKLDHGVLPFEVSQAGRAVPESLTDRKRLTSIIAEQLAGLRRTDSIYQLSTPTKMPRMATREELGKLTELYDSDWALLVGLDRSDPLKEQSGARTILTAIAKGLPGSRSNPDMLYDLGVKSYIYFLLHLAIIHSARIDDIKLELASVHSEFDGIETICGERWGLWDLGTWCGENEILFLPVQPTKDKQKEAFTELFQLYKSGLFKTPLVRVPGSKSNDILVEEALTFDYSPRLGLYGSPEKDEKHGVQDDALYSLGWGIWGGKNITVEDFRSRTAELVFGEYRKSTGLVGKY